MTSTCLDFLAQYAEFLDANTNISGVRPHPIFFSQVNCSGTSWPNWSTEPTADLIYNNPVNPTFGSMYIPPLWTVTLSNSGVSPRTFPSFQGSNSPVLIPDVATTFYNNGVSILNNVALVIIIQPLLPGFVPYTVPMWQLDMCMNRISTVVGAQHLTSWQGGSLECDAFMDTYCQPVAHLSCAPNSTQIAPLNQYAECVCKVEQNCLRDTFCNPDSENPNCTDQDAFALFVPVTCFGKQCSISGYRWQYMLQSRCNVTLCQQIISLVGDNIVVKGGSTLFCGNSEIPIVSVTTSPSPPQTTTEVLPLWAWVLIGIAVFIVAIAGPLSYLVYRQAKKRRETEALESSIDS